MGRDAGKAYITVHRPCEAVERLWRSWEHPAGDVRFADAPGDRGTEIHVEVQRGGLAAKLTRGDALAEVKDDLRRFKQQTETGEIPRSDGTPEGEPAARKRRPRPAQPLPAEAREEVGVR